MTAATAATAAAAAAAPPLADVRLSVNSHSAGLVTALVNDAQALGLVVTQDDSGVCVVDAGIAARSSIDAGLRIAEICMGGYGQVSLRSEAAASWPTWLQVHSAQPVLACLASQYAGWSLAASKEETGGKKFFALGSGPARALAVKEPLFAELGYQDSASNGSNSNSVLVMEVDRPPPAVVVQKILRDCRLRPDQLSLILTPTTSAAGTTQVVARVLEVALHKAHQLGFDLGHIVHGVASAPLPAVSPDGAVAMGRTNDAILYGGQVHLSVRGSDDAARALAQQLPSRHSKDFGRGFADIFKDAGYDFYKIDPGLFAPAEVWVSNLDTGQTWHAGALHMALLHSQWMQQA